MMLNTLHSLPWMLFIVQNSSLFLLKRQNTKFEINFKGTYLRKYGMPVPVVICGITCQFVTSLQFCSLFIS